MTTKGQASEIGENTPTEKSKMDLTSLVDEVVGEPAPSTETEVKVTDADPTAPEEGLEAEISETPESTAEPEGDKEATSEDDDVIPKSKYEKVRQKMQERIDSLTAKLKDRDSEANQPKTQEEKLEILSAHELNELRENIDDALLDAKVSAKVDGSDQTKRIEELRLLRRNVEKTARTAPERFMKAQVKHLEQMVAEVKDIDPAIVERKGDLWKTAANIYQRMPSLHRTETGQAEALAIATEYFLEKKQMDSGRARTSDLQQKVSFLKKKTALDSKTLSVDQAIQSGKKLRDKAKHGSYYDKLDFVKTLVPDDFLSTTEK